MITDLDQRALAGARICIADHDEIPCAISDSAGDYRLSLPVWSPTRPIAVHVSATGYLGATLLLGSSPGLMPPPFEAFSALWFPKIALTDDARAATRLSEKTGYRFPEPDRAFVEVDIRRVPPGPPVSATLTTTEGEGLSPVYSVFGPMWDSEYDVALTATTNGKALFAEVPPGRFEVLLTGCLPESLATGAWDGSQPNAVAGFAVAGSLTPVTVLCRKTDQ